MRKYLLTIITIIFLFIVLYFCRERILTVIGDYLIYENELEEVDALFVLGGGSLHRGDAAVDLYMDGFVKKVYCSSGNYSAELLALGMEYYESEVCRINVIRNGIPDSNAFAIKAATSTFEEADTILGLCKAQNIRSCIVLSSKFHTRRVKKVFKKRFEEAGIKTIIRGAPSLTYDEDNWWKDEMGLIMVNNEYVKLIYYFLKY